MKTSLKLEKTAIIGRLFRGRKVEDGVSESVRSALDGRGGGPG